MSSVDFQLEHSYFETLRSTYKVHISRISHIYSTSVHLTFSDGGFELKVNALLDFFLPTNLDLHKKLNKMHTWSHPNSRNMCLNFAGLV